MFSFVALGVCVWGGVPVLEVGTIGVIWNFGVPLPRAVITLL